GARPRERPGDGPGVRRDPVPRRRRTARRARARPRRAAHVRRAARRAAPDLRRAVPGAGRLRRRQGRAVVNGTAARRRVLCVDDNAAVAEALRIKLGRSGRFEWVGWLPAADRLIQLAATLSPALVVLDLDMPGADPFAQIAALREHSPDVRV